MTAQRAERSIRVVDYAAKQAEREMVLRDLPPDLREAVEALPIGEEQASSLPQSIEAEEAVIAAILLDDEALLNVLGERLEPADFSDARLAACYQAAVMLGERQVPITIPTLAYELANIGWLDRDGLSEPYLVELAGKYFTAIGVEAHARIVRNMAAARKVMLLMAQVGSIARMAPKLLDQLLGYLKDALDRVQSEGPTTASLTAEEVIQRVIAGDLEDGRPTIPTGLPLLDRALGGGFGIGELVVIAAKTSVGKTALTARIVYEQALRSTPVGVILLEGRHTKFLHRIAAIEAGVSLTYVERQGGWDPDEKRIYDEALYRTSFLPIHFADPVPRTALAIEQWMRTKARRDGIKHFVIDHIDRLRMDAKQRPDMAYREALQRWGNTANEEGFVVTCLSQVNRDVQWHPELRQLREAGAKEELAQIVLLLSQGDDATYSNATRQQHTHVFPSLRLPPQRRGVHLNVEVAKFTEGEVGFVTNAAGYPAFYVDGVSGAVMVRGE